LSAIGGTLDRALGFKVSPLLAMAAPFLLSQISQRMKSGGLDKAGVARLLQDEQKSLAAVSGPTSHLIQKALAAGTGASAAIARYSPEQWSKVRLGPIAAAGLVIKASPSGLAGAAKEVLAASEAVATLKKNTAPTSILNLAADKDVTADELKSLPTD